MELFPLSTAELELRLDELLQVEFTFLRADELAMGIAPLPRVEQDFLLDWCARIASVNVQLAFQFTRHTLDILARTERHVIEAWALHMMDTYDRAGLRPAVVVLEEIDRFMQHRHARTAGAVFEEEQGVLQHFAQGLAGRQLKLAESEEPYTDSDTLFLPPLIARLPQKEDNFLLYKVTVAFLWAQIRFGTFRAPLMRVAEEYPHPQLFLALFLRLEGFRIEACLGRELPGLHRQLGRLQGLLEEPALPAGWALYRRQLEQPQATVEDSLRLSREAYAGGEHVAPLSYQGVLRPDDVSACTALRIGREKMLLRVRLADYLLELEQKCPPRDEAPRQFSLARREAGAEEGPGMLELTLDDMPVAPPEDVRRLMSSIQLDLGEIPPEYLVPAGPGEYDPSLYRECGDESEDVWSGVYHERGAHLYHEWDYRRQAYRKNWVAVREREVESVHDGFVADTLEKYRGIVKTLRNTFEAMRDEDKLLKRQREGDGIDIDALVEALADAHDGSELSSQLFTRMYRAERNIAVMFMVDMSGSTRGWINEVEREALLLLCEALETLGDRYAIYGFSGMSRKRCEIFRIKAFDEKYNGEVQARISGIAPQDYTRMGFAIRHLSKILNGVEAKTRLLITLSDGKPDDYSDYHGEYGIEDTRRALIEARRSGIHPYCITIDEEARDYLPHMYGPAAYTLVSEVRELPLKVADIYRRLTR